MTNDPADDSTLPLFPEPVENGQPGSLGLATGSGSRFVDPQLVLSEAESWMQDVDMVEEEDRTEDEIYALALWDELRRLRNLCREALAMAEAWQDADGAPATDFVCRLRRASGLPNCEHEPRTSNSSKLSL